MAKKEDQRTRDLLAFLMPFDMVFFLLPVSRGSSGRDRQRRKEGYRRQLARWFVSKQAAKRSEESLLPLDASFFQYVRMEDMTARFACFVICK